MLVILTNIPTPYRTAFFDAVAAACAREGQGFHVLYCAASEPGRHWPYRPEAMRHPHTLLRGIHPRLHGISAHVNPGVLAALRQLQPTTLLVAGAWNTPTMLLAGGTGIPCRRVFWSEGHADAVLNPSGLIAWARRHAYRSYDAFAVPNGRSAAWAELQAGEPKPTWALPNAIDTDFYRPAELAAKAAARRALGLPASGRVLVQVGALSERKGPLPLVRAFLGLPSGTRGEATLALVGTGPLEAELNALSAVSAGAVRLFGHRDPAGVREILHAADTFVLNTFLDPNPLSPIEAGACGLPLVLSARAGNVAELIGASGLGIAIADPADPTEALRVALGWSDAELATLGRKARAATESAFSVIAVAADLVRRTR
jgi:glycosyltransferase involved in cell wall biosynthesis